MDASLLSEFLKTAGQTITCKAAVAWEANKPLDYTDIQVAPPKKGEVRIKVFANALCHTDIYTLEGHDPEGLFPSILGHEGTGIVESIGEGVTSVKPGDIVIPCYTPECREFSCIYCNNENTNLCPKIRAFQGKGLMPDGTSRFSKDGKTIYHFMGCSSFSEYTVVAEISCAKVSDKIDVNQMCLLGCGISTGWGAAINTCKVRPGSTVVVFGLGAVGLAVVQAAKIKGARKIVGIDLNSEKFTLAKDFGCTECWNPKELDGKTIKEHLISLEPWGYDFTFDCTGITAVMRDALEIAHRGFGESCVIGVAASGHEISTRPFQLVTGRQWKGTAFGGWKSRTEVPQLVQQVSTGELPIQKYITHEIKGLQNVNQAIDALHSGKCLRAVVHINERPDFNKEQVSKLVPRVYSNARSHNGWVKRVKHYSESLQCEMQFSIYIPDKKSRNAQLPPVLYYLSGLTCTDENALVKSGFQRYASELGIAVVFPDTSPRVDIEGDNESWDFGKSAGFYLNATQEKWRKNYNMFTYISEELPKLIGEFFPVDVSRAGITGHSMGGMGALNIFLKNPGKYLSVSAFAPICNPTQCPWGVKAFTNYLGSVEAGKQYDPTELIVQYNGPKAKILIDQGTHDSFLYNQLHPQNFLKAASSVNYPVEFRYQNNYDHLYFFVETFMGDHFKHHAQYLLR
ncbi:S-(hydroxymethyl)glutathione dehydrogenase/class III alcohol dehydrogenase (macronuclear) [Tetrahymena thermophila SB210]|uniref:S-formylglutathione hydrolase n=1 Tax=Tetrahymena thermophila (strain SB210) TaxID=312017 RepID=I7MIF3_TETTS|nr:S-(hydroxymethyl)glutathione dehydrogenase/class III alcohol dehydrogenase [Tetrahymena thermophila SB210]EAR92957.1 S-(hydroxymethyl)glutathione dehydrogenase/class III alcohol dehydrogenase [Tetrahymena thermophila SB210]|eukprot:XP_001013202.1 S-(hydroxymethyl)glutathione dehydrogenase/class III alcohol dehydrogenase [Tetrahymena thermophila SB210]